jgi:hypothetical protein
MARAHTPAAIQALADALASPRERVAAATVLLDRGWGKPRQQIEVSADDGVIALHLTAARALLSAFDAEGSRPPTIEAQPESEPAFNLLDAPKPVE